MDLIVSSRTVAEWTVIDAKGEVDIVTAPKFREKIEELIDQGQVRVLLNLLEVTFMGSSGIGVLVATLKRVKEHDGDLRLVCADGPVMRVLSITGLNKVLAIYGSVDEATSAA